MVVKGGEEGGGEGKNKEEGERLMILHNNQKFPQRR